jgi:succinate dehydrogenase / fumarate reductase flavoprotein subunit
MKIIKGDVIVIGAGGAGLRSALSAYEKNPNLKIILLAKKPVGKGGVTANAFSDRMAFHATLSYTLPIQNNYIYHAMDIYKIGGEVSDYNLAEILAKNSEEAINYLISIGVPFVKTQDGKVDQFLTDGSEYPRACYVGPNTAIDIAKALAKKVRETNIETYENVMVYDLIVKENRVIGAKAIDMSTQEKIIIKGKAFILATGGAGAIYRQNVFTTEMTGDGYAVSLRAGAQMVNMEFMQIGICHPQILFAESGSMFRALPKIVDEDGREFLLDYLTEEDKANLCVLEFKKGAHWPVSYESPTKVIDLAVYYHIKQGHKVYMNYMENPSYLSYESIPEEILRWSEKIGKEIFKDTTPYERLKLINPSIIEWLKNYNIDLSKELLPIQNALQHFQGGVKIREDARTSLEGLYAAGEVAGGQHGANRPGGNSLLDTQVFGKIAGESAVYYASKVDFVDFNLNEVEDRISQRGIPSKLVREKIRDIVSEYGFLVRMEEDVKKGISLIKEIKKDGVSLDENGLSYYYETLNMLDVAELILNAILIRDESRGPHLRFKNFNPPVMEFLPKRPEWNKYIIFYRKDGELKYEIKEPIRPNFKPEGEEK